MKKYFIKRFASTIPVLIGGTVLCFILMAMGWMIIIVFSIAILCARFHGKMFDHIVRVLTIGGICLPVFWLGFMLLLLFAVRLSIFSVVPKAGISGYILPSFALAFPSACGAIRVMRSSLLSEISSDYAALCCEKIIVEGDR